MNKRIIPVSKEWFEQLETYLQCDERFTDSTDHPRWWNCLILKSLEGKRLEFRVIE